VYAGPRKRRAELEVVTMRSLRLVFVLLLGLGISTGTAIAATQVSFTATLTLEGPGDPERSWQSGPILHVRGEPNAGSVSGDLNGPASIVNDFNLDLRTLNGTNRGTFMIASDDVTWEGTYRGTLRAGFNEGTFVGHGSDGSLIRGSFTQTDDVGLEFLLEGVILQPHE
jgi:hypothetical protein